MSLFGDEVVSSTGIKTASPPFIIYLFLVLETESPFVAQVDL